MADESVSKGDANDQNEPESEGGIGLLKARETLGDLVLRAGIGNEQIVITRNGKPIAALVGLKDLQRLQEMGAA